MQENILGIIGGLGPMATAYFLELTVKMTAADRDQEHLRAILMEAPDIPDRTAHILDRKEGLGVKTPVIVGHDNARLRLHCDPVHHLALLFP